MIISSKVYILFTERSIWRGRDFSGNASFSLPENIGKLRIDVNYFYLHDFVLSCGGQEHDASEKRIINKQPADITDRQITSLPSILSPDKIYVDIYKNINYIVCKYIN
ncbi:MAG: hypothetical protein CVU55_04590 [Deltaproteobacteria bacterium HGW-Deltaproteobacteria-13]|jgi:hypothetical protein|nr:MAG: hypothetical protein CVU55_04590 [Deltaproteobacteria bacterium HGW-Deltaproteobacteria-13]